MHIQRMLINLALALIFSATAALAGPPGSMFPPHGFLPMMGPTGLTADKQNLYVLMGPKILQYSLNDLKLLKSVDLPQPAPPEKEARPCPPPPGCGPQGLWAGDGSLFILAGPQLYRYSTPDLTLKKQAELPKPELPRTGK